MNRFAPLANIVGLLMLSGCSGSLSGHAFPNIESQRTSLRATTLPDMSFRVIYSFGKTAKDASYPDQAPIAVNGFFYGTTGGGGKSGDGTVYKMSPGGAETVLHSFNGADGQTPWAGLLYYNGAFYGTTFYGGTSNDGTVYRITPGGSFKLLRSFHGGSRDGGNPVGVLVAYNGTLYGTTGIGGPYNQKNGGYGTVFSITTGGSERILHFFKGVPDGSGPWGTLIPVNGVLYGTTAGGGKGYAGTVYRITTSGSEKILHNFKGSDGEQPEANALYQNGWLYGTSVKGGSYGFGTVFKIGLGGQFSTLYNFDGASNGCHPTTGLLSVNGNFFGSTIGTFQGSSCTNAGTVYKITPSGSLTTLHTFNGRNGGAEPIDYSGLSTFEGRLYGTTELGGDSNVGIVFSEAV
ncbi:MAG: choice-of-anchor tandem repeat GloVer-containing protein [Candidatus Tumulicola sp.]